MTCIDKAYITGHFYEALDRGLILPFFHPIYRSMTGKLVCAEALARWQDPDKGLLSPADFIPALEESGLIIELDMMILRKTCAYYQKLRQRGTLLHSFSVNLSRHDFKDSGLYQRVTGILEEYDVPHEAIKLEITESLMLDDIENFKKVFQQFSKAGFTIWIDDFGSGYSSLNVLQNYDFDVLKFDMLFLRNFSSKGKQMLASLINMAKTLRIHTLAEGVETVEQQRFLLAAGCEAQQGFLYSKPLSETEMTAMIDQDPGLLESFEDKGYWNQIGQFNFLSNGPMEEFSELEHIGNDEEDFSFNSGLPLALLECTQDKSTYVYANSNYISCVNELGFSSLSELEEIINNHRSEHFLMIKKMLADAIETGVIQKVEYKTNDVYYRLCAKCLAKRTDKAMIALRLSIFDSENEEKTAREMLNYGNALFSTYELAVLLYPENNTANRIYTSRNLPKYDREKTLKMTVQKFVETEVDPVDQERYLRFLNFQDIEQRLNENAKGFIQGFFRLFLGNSTSSWHSVRVTKIPSSAEKMYILTIQTIHGNGMQILESTASEHPDMIR